jgi:hypothetical protein
MGQTKVWTGEDRNKDSGAKVRAYAASLYVATQQQQQHRSSSTACRMPEEDLPTARGGQTPLCGLDLTHPASQLSNAFRRAPVPCG